MATEISRQGRVVKTLPTLFENNKGWAGKMEANEDELSALSDEERLNRLCELNFLAQARNVSRTNIIRGAWSGRAGFVCPQLNIRVELRRAQRVG